MLLAFLFFVGIAALLREVVCWYWKINELVRLMEKQHKLQVRMVDHLDTIAQALTTMAKADPADDNEQDMDASSPMLP